MTWWLLGSAALMATLLGLTLALGARFGFALVDDATEEQRSWVLRTGTILAIGGGLFVVWSLAHII